jgi:hypothetical protein
VRKCAYCEKEELCGVGKDNTPVCEKHFEGYLKGKRLEVDAAIKKLMK